MTTPHHTEVFRIDRATGWAFAVYDADRNQIGEAAYEYRQRDAIAGARRMHPELPTHVYNGYGEKVREVQA
jgi:hypothetical protein